MSRSNERGCFHLTVAVRTGNRAQCGIYPATYTRRPEPCAPTDGAGARSVAGLSVFEGRRGEGRRHARRWGPAGCVRGPRAWARPAGAVGISQRYPGRHGAPVPRDARARYLLQICTKKAERAMSARDARPPVAAPVGGRVRRTYERGESVEASQEQRGGRQSCKKACPPPDRIPTPPAPPSDAHNGKPSRTRPYPWPLPSKGGPTRWKRAGTQGSRGSNSHHTQLTRGRCLARRGSKPPSLLTERTR